MVPRMAPSIASVEMRAGLCFCEPEELCWFTTVVGAGEDVSGSPEVDVTVTTGIVEPPCEDSCSAAERLK